MRRVRDEDVDGGTFVRYMGNGGWLRYAPPRAGQVLWPPWIPSPCTKGAEVATTTEGGRIVHQVLLF
jgi:hypothetical protein